ncbi:ATP-binding protein [Chloroflexota bacterium]
MAPSTLGRISRFISGPHFWAVVAMFAIGVTLHYPQQILPTDSPSLFLFFGLTRHAVERIFFLLPVAYAGFFLGTKAGLVSLAISAAIMLPRVILISLYPADALFETCGVIIIGGLANLWFHLHRVYILQRKNAEVMLAKIIDGSPIPTFAINGQHKVTHWNAAIESLSGIKKEGITGTDGQWRAFYPEKRPVMADLIVDEATASVIETHYPDKCQKSHLIEGAYEAEDFFPALGEAGKWLHFTASPIKDSNGKIAGAIETLEDVTERKNAEKNVRYYLQEITRAQEEERKRIARELHDDTAQELVALSRRLDRLTSSVNISSQDISYLEELRQQTDNILDGVRRFSQDLRPSTLDDLGLVPALEWLTSDLSNHFGIAIGIGVFDAIRRFSSETELVLFRITQEALRNACKHSEATRAWVTLEFGSDKIILTVRDNGKGFELPQRIGDLVSTGKLGLAGMQERAQLIGGKLTVQSEPGKGTTVSVEVPSS